MNDQTSPERRQQLLKLASAAVFLAIVGVAVLIVVNGNKSSGGNAESIAGAREVDRELAGIPRQGLVLGNPGARVTLIEFGDLQCPVCKAFAEEVIPQVIDSKVRSGEAKIEFRNFTIIGAESLPAGAAAIAAGEQGRGWDYLKLFYRNQGTERSGYVTDRFLTAIAEKAGVQELGRWNRERKSRQALSQVEATTEEAEALGFSGTPSFAVEGASGPLRPIGTPASAGGLEAAIEGAG